MNYQPLQLPREVVNHSMCPLLAEVEVEFTRQWMAKSKGVQKVTHCQSTYWLDNRWLMFSTHLSKIAEDASHSILGSSSLPIWLVRHMRCKSKTLNRKIRLNVWLQTKISVKLVKQAWAGSGKGKMNLTYTKTSKWTNMRYARPSPASATSSLLSARCQDPPTPVTL